MYFPDEKMKVNRFKQVAIPRRCEYVRRFGSVAPAQSQYTGDEVAPLPQNKVDQLWFAEQYDAMMQERDRQKLAEEQKKASE